MLALQDLPVHGKGYLLMSAHKKFPKNTKELLKFLDGIPGVRVEQSKKNAHYKVFCPNGGMVPISHTTSDQRAVWSAIRYLRQNGIEF